MKIQYVEWRDHSAATYWQEIRDTQNNVDNPFICKTIGFLVAEGEKEICIASTISANEQTTCRIHILKSDITKRKTLKNIV